MGSGILARANWALLLAAVSIAPAGALAQTSRSSSYADKTVGGWHYDVDKDGCSVATTFTERSSGLGSNLYVSYKAATNTVWLGFGHDKFRSIKNSEKYKIGVKLIINGKLDDGWGETDFHGVRDDDTKAGNLVANFTGDQMLVDLAKATGIAFYKDDAIIAAFPLKGSAPIMQGLKACGDAVEAEHPHDPFAE